MHIPAVHAELNLPVLHAFIRQYPLGLFTTSIPHPKNDTLQMSHIPFVLDVDPDQADDKGRLRGHMARVNPQSKSIIDSLSAKGDSTQLVEEDILIVFNASVHSYVTPKFYLETKPTSGKVVPTWDYAAVQVYGRAKIHYANNDTTGSFLQKQIQDLSEQEEKTMLKRTGNEGGSAWKVSDAPEKYVEILKKAIIGVEIDIKKIEGRFKLSQEKNGGDWQGVVSGFRSLGTDEGNLMAEMVEENGKKS